MATEEQWAWLGLLKWSLAYTDGTVDGAAPPMSEEDKAFVEGVMKDGIINENDRMKTILKDVSEKMTKWTKGNMVTEEEEEEAGELLQELRDCVEQIDFARSFAAMKGLEFLVGCVQERQYMPKSVRILCLGILATMSSNNPPIQKQLLDLGALKVLSDIFFVEQDSDANGTVRARTMQAIGAIVRSHELAETVFVQLEQAPELFMAGLGMGTEYSSTPQTMRQRTLFLLRALVSSDSPATVELMKQRFRSAVVWVADYVVDDEVESSAELRELALEMIQLILEQKKMASAILERKETLIALAVRQAASLRKLTGEEREYAQTELGHWEAILVLLSNAGDAAAEPTTSKDAPKMLNQ